MYIYIHIAFPCCIILSLALLIFKFKHEIKLYILKVWINRMPTVQKMHISRYVCESCSKDFKTKQTLNRHRVYKHNVDCNFKLTCPHQDCNKVFFEKARLEDHVNKHSNSNSIVSKMRYILHFTRRKKSAC